MSNLYEQLNQKDKVEKTVKDFFEFKKNLTPSSLRTYQYIISDLDEYCAIHYNGDSGYDVIQDLKKIKDEKKNGEEIMRDELFKIISGWVNYCITKEGTEFRKKQHVNTALNRLSKLRAFIQFFGLYYSNREVKQYYSFPKRKKIQPPPLELEEVQKIFKVCGEKWYPLLLIMCSTGCRIDEVLRLQKKRL